MLGVGSDFRPGTLLRAYRSGIFPWPHSISRESREPNDNAPASRDAAERGVAEPPLVLWFSPSVRAIFPLEAPMRWSRSLRRTLRSHPYEITLDEDFVRVMRMCGDTRPKGTWIIPELIEGYAKLHAFGWAHSVEIWEKGHGSRVLVGGIYGVSVGCAFAGESMFHTRTDTSKIAFATLAEALRRAGYILFDVQVLTSHLASLGCIEVPRTDYLARLENSLLRTPKPLSIFG